MNFSNDEFGSHKTSSNNQIVPFTCQMEANHVEKVEVFGSHKVVEYLERYFQTEVMGLSQLTIKAKREDLNKFLNFINILTGTVDLSEWMPSDTRIFIDELKKRDYAATTINRILATLRSFGRWLRDEGILQYDPCRRIKEMQIMPFTPKRITDLEYKRLLRTSEVLESAKCSKISQHHRNKALMVLLNNTGLRIWEVLGLKLHQVSGKEIKQVRCKGGKVRDIKISKECAETVSEYVRLYRTTGSDYLFTNRYGGRLSRNGIAKALNKLAAITNVHLKEIERIKITPHKFRHSVGHRARELKGDVWAAERLGHSSLNYIGRYATLTEAEEEGLVEKL